MVLMHDELVRLSPQELHLVELIIEAYRCGSITGIESYSGGCRIPKNTIREIIAQHSAKHPGVSEAEQFVFSMYMSSSESDEFMAKHKIARTRNTSNGMQEIAEYTRQSQGP